MGNAPKPALEKDKLSRDSIFEGRRRFIPTGVPRVIVIVEDGYPTPQQVWVTPEATVQFVNQDPIDYKLRLWTRNEDHHADVDVILPARGSVTVIVDPNTPSGGQCYYELLPFNISGLGPVVLPIQSMAAAPPSPAEDVVHTGLDQTPTTQEIPTHAYPLSKSGGHGPGGGVISVP